MQAAPENFGHFDQPLITGNAGEHLTIGPIPTTWKKGAPPFAVQIDYGNAPENAGLVIYVYRDTARYDPPTRRFRFTDSGGALSSRTIPIEGAGIVTAKFDGKPWSAPNDLPQRWEMDPGRYVLVAELLNHREPTVGLVALPPDAKVLASAKSAPFFVTGKLTKSGYVSFRWSLRRAFEDKLERGLDLWAPGVDFPTTMNWARLES